MFKSQSWYWVCSTKTISTKFSYFPSLIYRSCWIKKHFIWWNKNHLVLCLTSVFPNTGLFSVFIFHYVLTVIFPSFGIQYTFHAHLRYYYPQSMSLFSIVYSRITTAFGFMHLLVWFDVRLNYSDAFSNPDVLTI